jgi:TctA family transporter
MNFFVDLTKELLSPRALKGFLIGLFIGVSSVAISIFLRSFIKDPNYTTTPVIGQLIGAALVALYGQWFASKKQDKKKFALVLFFIAGLLGFFLVRLVIENRFNLPPSTLINNVISYALSCGIVCALAGGLFEAITQSE